jgi:acetyl-CoA acetyltransferase
LTAGGRRGTGALIIGAGETPYTRRAPPAGTLALIADAARRALDDAGLDPRDVDGLALASFTAFPDHAIDLAWRLGLRLRWLMEDTNGGAAGLNMLQHARRAIEAGDAGVVLIVAGDVFEPGEFARLAESYNSATRDHLTPLLHGGPNALFALLAQRHMREHRLSREAYGQVAIAQRAWAGGNPDAVYRSPLTMQEYLAAPLVADPLGRFDCVPVVSGADAVVVSTPGRAGRAPAVVIRALGARYNDDQQRGDGLVTGLAALAPSLWDEAGLDPGSVDLVEVYDDYTVMVLVQLADLGFVGDLDLTTFVAERIATRRLPVNTSGGQLSAGQAGAAGGLHGLVEAVRQLRGQAGERQVRSAETAVVTGYGTVVYRHGASSNAAVLGRVE